MDILLKLLTVFALGVAEIFLAIPAGFVLKLHPVAVGLTAALGGMLGVFVITFLGERLRARLLRYFAGNRHKGKQGRIRHLWERYGVAGLGLLAPILVGPPLGTALGLVLGAPARRLLFWMSLGVLLWCALLTLAASLGLALFRLF